VSSTGVTSLIFFIYLPYIHHGSAINKQEATECNPQTGLMHRRLMGRGAQRKLLKKLLFDDLDV
jgi:hypothetical protein